MFVETQYENMPAAFSAGSTRLFRFLFHDIAELQLFKERSTSCRRGSDFRNCLSYSLFYYCFLAPAGLPVWVPRWVGQFAGFMMRCRERIYRMTEKSNKKRLCGGLAGPFFFLS